MSTMVRCTACGLSIIYEEGHAGADGITYCPECCPACADSVHRNDAGIPVRSAMNAMTLSAVSGLAGVLSAAAMMVCDDVNKALSQDVDTVAYEMAIEQVRSAVERVVGIAKSVSTVSQMLEGSVF